MTVIIPFLYLVDPPRDSKIVFDAVKERCSCHANGNPLPSYIWLWLAADGKRKVVSTNQYLDMTSFPGRGFFRFRCIVSNMISNTRYTSVLEIRMHVSSTLYQLTVRIHVSTTHVIIASYTSATRADIHSTFASVCLTWDYHNEAAVHYLVGYMKVKRLILLV